MGVIDINPKVKKGVNPHHYTYGYSSSSEPETVTQWYEDSNAIPWPEGPGWLFMKSKFTDQISRRNVNITCNLVTEICGIFYNGMQKGDDAKCKIIYRGLKKDSAICYITYGGLSKDGSTPTKTPDTNPDPDKVTIPGQTGDISDGSDDGKYVGKLYIGCPPGDASLISVELIKTEGNYYYVKDTSAPASNKRYLIDSRYWTNDLAAIRHRQGWPVLVQVYLVRPGIPETEFRNLAFAKSEMSFQLY